MPIAGTTITLDNGIDQWQDILGSYLKENKLIESNKLLDFKQPETKVTCEFGQNRCYSRVAHVELEGETFVQFAIRGCASQNATLGINDAYYVER